MDQTQLPLYAIVLYSMLNKTEATPNMQEDKQYQYTQRCRVHTSVWPRRDRKITVRLKGVPLALNPLAVWYEGVGKWVSPSLRLAQNELGEASSTVWGLQAGGQSGGRSKIRLFLDYVVFGHECSCWHVISLAVVTQGWTGAKVNHQALLKHTHTQKHTRLSSCESGHKGLCEILKENFCRDKKHWAV